MNPAWLLLAVPVVLGVYAVAKNSGPAITRILNLEHAPFPGEHGEALVYIPAGLDTASGVDVVVYFHGWSNCIQTVVGTAPRPCTPGGPNRGASDLLGQFARSGRRAILVVPQLKFDAASGDAGMLTTDRWFADMLLEIQQAMGLGPVRSVTLYAHSGGYVATNAVLMHGGVPILGVCLLDALYGYSNTFYEFAQGGGKLASLYTADGGTRATNVALAAQLGVPAQSELVWTGVPLFAEVPAAHGSVPTQYFQTMLGVV